MAAAIITNFQFDNEIVLEVEVEDLKCVSSGEADGNGTDVGTSDARQEELQNNKVDRNMCKII